MGRVRTKICGIGSVADLNVAVQAGADALGVIVGITHVSEDELSAPRAREVCSAAPAFISTVLVTHLPDPDEILHLAETIGVDTIQVHGDGVSADSMRKLWHRRRSLRIIRTVHVTGPCAIDAAREAATAAHAVLLDTRTTARLGGTGRTHDWRIRANPWRFLRSGHDHDIRCSRAAGSGQRADLRCQRLAADLFTTRPTLAATRSGWWT
ncbi:phosphoribosylanthranilate isomerase [Mycobacterium simiae]|uniref:N-(5'-phosphoribosyl)anthranilate isomerase n=1 Tax=Mycobacterium simiae TaxID=1784 RepID=A0A5B1BFK7_MYCSI|nr:phosphoribosylanthranilate isomerase [Mycobacterium simiae]KAA1247397.1 phosphoribosylanthranilate isomerase [Mycobacterium simiae]